MSRSPTRAPRADAPSPQSAATAGEPGAGGLLIIAVAALGAVIAANLLSLDFAGHALRDSDGYMRAVRVRELLAGAVGWFESAAPRGNAPYGHSMHWTRPMDIAILALALPLRLVLDHATALYFAAAVIGPLLHLSFAGAVYWTARPLLAGAGAVAAALLASVQPVLLSYAAAGRADHHVLILLVAALTVGAAIRLLLADDAVAPRAAVIAGTLAALGVWVSTESLLPLVIVALTLAANWALHPGEDARRHVGFWSSFTLALAGALLVERGPAGFAAVEYDRISLPYVVLGALGTIAWLVILRTAGDAVRPGRRAAVLGACGATAALVLVLLFPGMLAGPFADVPPELRERWLDRIVELRPLRLATLNAYDLAQLVLPVAGLLLVIRPLRTAPARARRGWWLVAAAIALGLAAAVTGLRLVVYPQTFAALPAAYALSATFARLQRTPLPVRVVAQVGLTLLAAFAWIPVTWLPLRAEAGPPGGVPCDVAAAATALRRAGIHQPVILAGNAYGPELLYRLDATVVSTPYHRNVRGILDALDAFESEPAAAAPILQRRGVDIIAVCPAGAAGEFAHAAPGSLHRRLLARTAPLYATLLSAPADAGGFLLYRVSWN